MQAPQEQGIGSSFYLHLLLDVPAVWAQALKILTVLHDLG